MEKEKTPTFSDPHTFGETLDLDVPNDCGMVILCMNTSQHRPVWIGYPHQLYKHTILRFLKEYPSAWSFSVMPYNNNDKQCFDVSSILKEAQDIEKEKESKRQMANRI